MSTKKKILAEIEENGKSHIFGIRQARAAKKLKEEGLIKELNLNVESFRKYSGKKLHTVIQGVAK